MADQHYETEVNKGDLNMNAFTRGLNDKWEKGYRLVHVFVQGGNTITVWEKVSAG